MNDLVKQWKEAARRDDILSVMVPSDVRLLVKEIELLRTLLHRAVPMVAEALNGQPVLDDIDEALGSVKEARDD